MMATAVLTCERLHADLDGRPGAPLSQASTDALALAPGAAAWARRFTHNISISHRAFRRQAAPAIVRYAVQGIIEDCTTSHAAEPGCRTSRHGKVATTRSPRAAKAAATVSGQITA
jgi:hypothetical protein